MNQCLLFQFRLVPDSGHEIDYPNPLYEAGRSDLWQEADSEDIRRVLRKGASFDMLRQDDVDRMLSHVNGYPRPSLDGKTPYDEFVSFHGERGREFLDKLNIRRVNPEFVTLDPSLLGPKFKREADNAILRRKGVTE